MTTAVTVSLIAHAAITWEASLQASREWENLVRNLDWAADYLFKCAAVPRQFVAQVGDHYTEDSYWGAPEDQTSTLRPVWVVHADEGGADVVAQGVAALAGASMLLRRPGSTQDITRADGYLQRAKEMWSWARSMEGTWGSPEGNNTVLSQTYADDKAWAAAWLCRSEVDSSAAAVFCADAAALFAEARLAEPALTTGNMFAAAALLLRDLDAGDATGHSSTVANYYLGTWANAHAPCKCRGPHGPCTVPGGLTTLGGPGASHLTVNMAFTALAVAANPRGIGVANVTRLRCWAKRQVGYLLGDNPERQAYVTGLDLLPGYSPGDSSFPNFPRNPRHRGSACSGGAGCAAPSANNPNSLPGALVGGPRRDGSYTDGRDNGPGAGVSIEYNAGFVAALLGLYDVERQLVANGMVWEDLDCDGLLSESPPTTPSPPPEPPSPEPPPAPPTAYAPRDVVPMVSGSDFDRLIAVPYAFVCEPGGNLVIYKGSTPIATSGSTQSPAFPPYRLEWLTHGLQYVDSRGTAVWSWSVPKPITETAFIFLYTDGVVYLYDYGSYWVVTIPLLRAAGP